MKQITLEETVNAPKAKVWEVLVTQFGDVHKWNPNLEGSHFEHGVTEGGLNCERHCSLDDKTFFKERITDLKEGESANIQIISSNFPFVHKMSGEYHLKSLSENRTRVRIVVSVSTKPALMVHLLKLQMGKLLKKSLVGLKYYLETGNNVSASNYRNINMNYKKLSANQAFAH